MQINRIIETPDVRIGNLPVHIVGRQNTGNKEGATISIEISVEFEGSRPTLHLDASQVANLSKELVAYRNYANAVPKDRRLITAVNEQWTLIPQSTINFGMICRDGDVFLALPDAKTRSRLLRLNLSDLEKFFSHINAFIREIESLTEPQIE